MTKNDLGLLNEKGLEMIREIISCMAKAGSEYSIRTSPARLEEIRRDKEQTEKERQARETWEIEKRMNSGPRYERNKTMKLLGKQSVERILYTDPAIHKMYEDLLEAERQAGPYEAGGYEMDLCAIGYLAGIRSERARRKASATQAGQGQGRKGKADK